MHEPYRRIVPGAKCAVVFIHGIVSTPRFWDDYVRAVPEDCSVHSLLLPGHGGSVIDFGRPRRGAWQACVDAAIDEMRRSHQRVYLVGHSMGTLLSILHAVQNPERIAGMLLLAVPLRIFPKPSALIGNILKGVGLTESPETLAAYYGTEQDWRFWRYIPWIPRYLELFALSAAARRALHRLNVPATAFMCGRDELVSLRSCRDMASHPQIDIRVLERSMHHELHHEDKQAVLAFLRNMCSGTEAVN